MVSCTYINFPSRVCKLSFEKQLLLSFGVGLVFDEAHGIAKESQWINTTHRWSVAN